MKRSSFHGVAGILLMALVVTGFQFCRESLSADDLPDEAVPAKAKPRVKRAKAKPRAEVPDPEAKPRAEAPVAEDVKPAEPENDAKPVMLEKVAGDGPDAEVGLDALIAPLQELFGFGVRNEVMIEGGVQVEVAGEPAANANGGDIENNPMAMQFLQMHQSKLKAELGFVRLMCSDLAVEQRPKVRKAAENCLKKFAKRIAKQQNQMGMGGFGVNQFNQEPVKLIREAIVEALKEVLSEEQIARYQDESQKRIETRKRAVILSVISTLDGKLFLDQEQRDKIEKGISSRWQDDWDKWSMYSQFGGQYLPPVPDDCVVHCLSAEQKKVWGGIQKVEFGWWNNDNMQPNDDDQWWGVDANGGDQMNPAMIQGGGIIMEVVAPVAAEAVEEK